MIQAQFDGYLVDGRLADIDDLRFKRAETLGDSFLTWTAIDWLVDRFPSANAETLTLLKEQVIKRDSWAQLSRLLNIKGETNRIKECRFEAMFGYALLDQTDPVMLKDIAQSMFAELKITDSTKNPKNMLGELCQRERIKFRFLPCEKQGTLNRAVVEINGDIHRGNWWPNGNQSCMELCQELLDSFQ